MDIQTNPFEDDIVEDPRTIKTCVTNLNEKPLKALIEKFNLLLENPFPRKLRHSHALLVSSSEPGYGKSHLIGRLFRELNEKATLVYIRPFENISTCWKSILLKIIHEMDSDDVLDYSDDCTTQLEVFSHGILTYLISQLHVPSLIEADKETTDKKPCENSSANDFLNSPEKINWVFSNIGNLASQFIKRLKKNRITLNASVQSWLMVLLHYYIYNRSDFETRETCIEWLKGESVDRSEANKIGIRNRDVPPPEMAPDDINELCKQRVIDLCHLAGFFRPFLFCFDQTENYGKTTELARSFGIVIETLVSACPNQMTVVTVNQHVWEKIIAELLEWAHQHRFNKRFELEGINKEQGRELIQQRLGACKTSNDKIRRFAEENWLCNIFREKTQIGIRTFINKCRDRWDKELNREYTVAPIESYFEKNRKDVLSHPKRHVFDPDILYWMIFEVANGLDGVTVKKYKTEKGYFTIQWLYGTRSVIFGFESGSNSIRWRSIAREAKRYALSQEGGSKAFILRTFDLPEIPKPTWKTIGAEIKEAQKEFLDIIYLSRDMVINIYAANELYRDAVEGDIPYSQDDILAFIRKWFAQFWDAVITGMSSEIEKKCEKKNKAAEIVTDEIKANIKKEKLLSLDELITSSSKSVDKEMVIDACNKVKQIKIYQSPRTTLLQWNSKQ